MPGNIILPPTSRQPMKPSNRPLATSKPSDPNASSFILQDNHKFPTDSPPALSMTRPTPPSKTALITKLLNPSPLWHALRYRPSHVAGTSPANAQPKEPHMANKSLFQTLAGK